MRWFDILRLRLRSIFFRRDVERELSEELQFHAVQGRLAGAEQIKEECRDARGITLLEHLVRDLRFSLRLFRRNPGFTTLAIVTLALGIGSTTAIFGVIDGVLLRPLPFPESDRLVRVWEGKVGHGPMRNVVNGWNFLEWQARSRSFEAMAAVTGATYNITGEGEPVSVPGAQVSADFFPILRVQPALGRWFRPEECQPGRTDTVILSYGLWQSRYGSDPAILGKKIQLGGTPATIVGVMPDGFTFVTTRRDLWAPLPIVRDNNFKSGRFLTTVARLKPGVTVKSAAAEMIDIGAQMAKDRPDYDAGWTVEVLPVLDDLTENVRRPLFIMLGAVGCLLLIACANVANLLLMRGSERTREMAVRASLGAGRGQILRQLLTEGLMLAAFACVTGIALARGGLEALRILLSMSSFLPRLESIHLDARVLLFAVGVSALTSVLFGLFPAVRVARVELHDALKQGSRTASGGHRKFRSAFVTAQVALALVLLTGAGLLGRSFARLVDVNPGFNTSRLLTMNFLTSPARFTDNTKRADYVLEVVRAVAALPGVEAAGTVHMRPLEEMVSGSCYGRVGRPDPNKDIAHAESSDMLVVSPGYLRAMGIPLMAGRDFSAQDRRSSPSVVMVTQSFASKVFPGENPIGRQLNICWPVANPVEIVGVTGDIRQRSLEKAPRHTILIAAAQAPPFFNTLLVRTSGDPAGVSRGVQDAVHRVNPDQALFSVRTMEEVFARNVAQPRFQSILLAVFAGIALALAGIGVYGVLAYSVTQRTREIGIRVVLGATRSDVLQLVLHEGALLAGAGLVVGLAGSIALSGLLRDLLFEIAPSDPPTLISVAALLGFIAIVASVIPARRAAQIAPVVTLREE